MMEEYTPSGFCTRYGKKGSLGYSEPVSLRPRCRAGPELKGIEERGGGGA